MKRKTIIIVCLGLVFLFCSTIIQAISTDHYVRFGEGGKDGYSHFTAIRHYEYIDGVRVWYFYCNWVRYDGDGNILESHCYTCPIIFPV